MNVVCYFKKFCGTFLKLNQCRILGPVTQKKLLKLLFKRERACVFTQIEKFETCFKISNYQDKNSNL